MHKVLPGEGLVHAACSVLRRLFQGDRARGAASISDRLVACSNLAIQDPQPAAECSKCVLVLQDVDWGFQSLESAIKASYSTCTINTRQQAAVMAGYLSNIPIKSC